MFDRFKSSSSVDKFMQCTEKKDKFEAMFFQRCGGKKPDPNSWSGVVGDPFSYKPVVDTRECRSLLSELERMERECKSLISKIRP